jgi:phytoene dehydrogenase-like protein
MKIAVIGSGIAGLASSWVLSRKHDVTLFEANDYLGGHTHTHAIELGGRNYAVDTGFIVFNPSNYPLLSKLFAELGVESQPTTMSFAVRNERSGLEYNATSLSGLFCQKRNLVSPRFLGMLRDIARFYRGAGAARCRRRRTDARRVSRRARIRRRVLRRSHRADGFGVVVLAVDAGTALPGGISGAVHGQPSHAAGERSAAVAHRQGRIAIVRARAARALARA